MVVRVVLCATMCVRWCVCDACVVVRVYVVVCVVSDVAA